MASRDEITVGSIVVVQNKWTERQKQDWPVYWNPKKDDLFGEPAVVRFIGSQGVDLWFEDQGKTWTYPYQLIEVLEYCEVEDNE